VIRQLRARVESAFACIAERMAGQPPCNPGLRVELVGLREWQGLFIGVLITPWTINLLLLPGGQPLRRLGPDERERRELPSGEYEFMGGTVPALGNYHSCSLFSPPVEFETQEEARAVAVAALYALFEAADNTPFERETARQPLSRRGFLTGGTSSRTR